MKRILLALLILASLAGCVLADDLDQTLSGNTYTAVMKDPVQAQTDKIIAGLSTWGLIWGLLFNSVGVFAFLYGKKQSNVPFIVIGILLTVYPYVVQQTVMIFIVGLVLSGALYFFRRNV